MEQELAIEDSEKAMSTSATMDESSGESGGLNSGNFERKLIKNRFY